MTIAELIAMARANVADNEAWVREQGGEIINPGLVPILADRIEQLAVTNEQLIATNEALEAKLSKTEGLLAMAMHVIKQLEEYGV